MTNGVVGGDPREAVDPGDDPEGHPPSAQDEVERRVRPRDPAGASRRRPGSDRRRSRRRARSVRSKNHGASSRHAGGPGEDVVVGARFDGEREHRLVWLARARRLARVGDDQAGGDGLDARDRAADRGSDRAGRRPVALIRKSAPTSCIATAAWLPSRLASRTDENVPMARVTIRISSGSVADDGCRPSERSPRTATRPRRRASSQPRARTGIG